MEKYPFLNEAFARVLRKRRADLSMSKKKLSEEAMIERAYITQMEAGRKCPTLNVFFCLCVALDITPIEFTRALIDEIRQIEYEVSGSNGQHAAGISGPPAPC